MMLGTSVIGARFFEIGDVLPGHLHVAGWSPYFIWPLGAMIGYTVLMLVLSSRAQDPAAS